MKDFEEAVLSESDNSKAFMYRAVAHSRIGDYDIALDDITTAIELGSDVRDTERLRLVSARADISVAAGRYDSAISDLNEVIRRYPHDAEVIFHRAVANLLNGDYKSARADSDRSLFAYTHVRLPYPIPNWLSVRVETFMDFIRRREGLDLESAEYWHLLGIAHFLQGDAAGAVKSLTRAITIQPDYAEAFRDRAYVYYQWMLADAPHNYEDDCERDFDEAVRLNPGDPLTYYFRGWTQSALFQNDSRAIEEFTMAISLNFRKAELYYSRGYAYASAGSYEDSINDYSMAIRLDPGWDDAYEARAESYQNVGEDDKAAEDREKVEEFRRWSKTLAGIIGERE